MLIKVTEEHIRLGNRESAKSCPVALAVQEATKADMVTVSSRIEVYQGATRNSMLVPDIVNRFVVSFDNALPVEPIEFELKYDYEGPR